jgi:hypothetical protein
VGWNKAHDSVGVGALTLSDGSMSTWYRAPGSYASVSPTADGTALVLLARAEDAYTFIKLLGPGQSRVVGTPPRLLDGVTFSRDMKRAAVVERDYRADAWMSTVIR